MDEINGMNVLDLPTEAGHHQCGRGGGGSGGGRKIGAKSTGPKAKQMGAQGMVGRGFDRLGVIKRTRGLNITRAKTSQVKTG